MPKITVLMSVYNGEKYLRQAMESILNQTFRDFEFLIINDASNDASKEIILSYSDPRIVYVENEENLGLTRSLNKGLKMAKGEYVARMDADDLSLLERLQKQVEFLDKNKEVVLLGSCSEFIDENGEVFRKNNTVYSKEELFYNLTFGNVFPHSSVMFRKKEVLDLGGYNEEFKRSQDFELWNRISRKYAVNMLDDVLLQWRNLKDNISNKFKESQGDDAFRVFSESIKELFSDNFYDIKKIRCFYDINKNGWNETRVRLKNIFWLWIINGKLIKKAPAYINRKKLRKIANDRVILFLKKRLGDFIG